MPWIFALVGLIAGIVIGVLITRLTTPDYKKHKVIQKNLDAAKYELEQKRQEVADHFAQTAEMLDTLGKDYTKLYQHMENTSAEMLSHLPEQDNPFSKKTTTPKTEEPKSPPPPPTSSDEAPKDYASGSSGLLEGDSDKEYVKSAEVVTLR
ncbi:Z-ring associated protein ZapG [Vibrio sp. S4M6]|uniref:Z-ring associated protein ZapG n=1 Tax=Vibrio sinus TaxID=2946865 RepID=UPI002029E338|nr:Z-ring associated protein ZapG [Vibrio sinus]MCL9781493.1 Z-ring associated protein ZapG [Vibrio sinus]